MNKSKEFAYGFLGLKPWEFWDEIDVADLASMINGYCLKEKYEFSLHTQSMSVMRWVGSLVYNTNVKRAHRRQAERLYPFPGEKIPQKPLITKDQLLAAREGWNKIQLKKDGSKSRNA